MASGSGAGRRRAGPPSFAVEVRDLLAFIRRPRVAPRLPDRSAGANYWSDWFPALPWRRLFQWALLLWALNLFFLGPLAVMAAGLGGASHRLNLQNIPWLTALLWAPVVEELVFRYGLRRVKNLWWLLPLGVAALMQGASPGGGFALAGFLLLCWLPYLNGHAAAREPLPWSVRRGWLAWFPWIFHASSLAFSALHLFNFNLAHTPVWLLPLLVLPQWVTGMVLGWLRVRRGIGASIVLHAIFNGGPLLLVWIALQVASDPVT